MQAAQSHGVGKTQLPLSLMLDPLCSTAVLGYSSDCVLLSFERLQNMHVENNYGQLSKLCKHILHAGAWHGTNCVLDHHRFAAYTVKSEEIVAHAEIFVCSAAVAYLHTLCIAIAALYSLLTPP